MAKRVAVILSGCGVYDGTEIHEASAVLVHLSRDGADVRQMGCWFGCVLIAKDFFLFSSKQLTLGLFRIRCKCLPQM